MSITTSEAKVSYPVAAGSDSRRGARVFVWGVWTLSLLASLAYVWKYGTGSTPFSEDWYLIPVLTYSQPVSDWAWKPVEEHWSPVPRLIILASYKLSGKVFGEKDFRAAMFLSVLALGALSFALIRTAGSLRGRMSYADAFFPLVLLHWGHHDIFLVGYLLVAVVPFVLAGAVLIIIVRHGALMTPRHVFLAGACLVLLPMCTGIGLLYVPPLALCLGYAGTVRWRSAAPHARRDALLMLACASAGLLMVGIYFFIVYEGTHYHPPSPGLWANLRTALQFLASGFGPAAEWYWPFSGLVVFGLLLLATAFLALAWRRHPQERSRVLGLLLFMAAVAALALAVGWNRAGRSTDTWDAGFARRYPICAVPILCCVYFIPGIKGVPTAGRFLQPGLFLLACVSLPLNYWEGFANGKAYRGQSSAFEQDVLSGVPPFMLIGRYTPDYFMGYDPYIMPEEAEARQTLRAIGIGPFRHLQEDPAFREVPFAGVPASLNQMTWENGTGRTTGKDSYAVFSLPEPRFVAGVRIKFRYVQPSKEGKFGTLQMLWKRSDQDDFSEPVCTNAAVSVLRGNPAGPFTIRSQYYHGDVARTPDEQTVTIWVGDTIDRFRIYPDDKPCVFSISEIVLLIPAGDWQAP